MYDIVRDSVVGQIVRYITGSRHLRYAEERSTFQHPSYPLQRSTFAGNSETTLAEKDLETQLSSTPKSVNASSAEDQDRPATSQDENKSGQDYGEEHPIERLVTQQSHHELDKTISKPIEPTRTNEGITLVDWYTTGMI